MVSVLLLVSLYLLFLFWVAKLLTGRLAVAFSKKRILARPKDGHIHARPVPKGAGIIIIGMMLPIILLSGWLFDNVQTALFLILGSGALSFISLLDDFKTLSPSLRLGVQACSIALMISNFSPQELLFHGHLPLEVDRLITFAAWLWYINLYNFMDGIDGMTGVQTICVCIGLAILLVILNIAAPFIFILALSITALTAGFLVHNWPPARVFIGEVGSTGLGFLTGYLLISSAMIDGLWMAVVILPLYYCCDATLTLVRRLFRGENVFQRHLTSYFHRAVIGGFSHRKTILIVAALNTILILSAVCVALHNGNLMYYGFATFAIVITLALLSYFHAQAPLDRRYTTPIEKHQST